MSSIATTNFPRRLTPALTAIALLLALTGCATKPDEAAHRTAAEQFLTLSGMDKQVDRNFDMIKSSMVQGFENSGAPAEARPIFERHMGELVPKIERAMTWEHTKVDYVDQVVESFTEDELQELVKFYSSPLGKKSLDTVPEVFQKGTEKTQQRLDEIKPEVERITNQMSSEIRALMGGQPGQ